MLVAEWDGGRVDHTLDGCVPSLGRRGTRDRLGAMELSTGDAKAERADDLVRLGARVRELRLERGLTQEALAMAIGVHRVNLNKFEHGRTDLGVSRIRVLAEALRVDPGQLFDK